jgi:hypothetical protein
MRIRYYCTQDENGKTVFLPDEGQMRRLKDPTFHFIPDDMPPTLHPCNKKFYTSKAKFRAETRAHGKIEVGNEKEAFWKLKPTDPRPPMSESVKEAYEFHRCLEGKSEGERREMEHRFFGPEQD